MLFLYRPFLFYLIKQRVMPNWHKFASMNGKCLEFCQGPFA